MRSRTRNTVAALCAALALTGAAATASAAKPAAHSGRQPAAPVIVDCMWHTHVRPAHFLIACGDGNSRLTALHWSRWNTTSARATALNVVNDCKPYCAAGKFHSYPVVVRLDHPQPWKKDPRVEHFTRMRLVYTDGRPDGFPRTVTYPLWN